MAPYILTSDALSQTTSHIPLLSHLSVLYALLKSIILLNTPAMPPPETCSIYYLAIFELFQISLLPQHVPQPTSLLLYTKCFSTLRCCGWEFGYTLMPLTHCAGRGGVFGKMGNGRACMILQCNV